MWRTQRRYTQDGGSLGLAGALTASMTSTSIVSMRYFGPFFIKFCSYFPNAKLRKPQRVGRATRGRT